MNLRNSEHARDLLIASVLEESEGEDLRLSGLKTSQRLTQLALQFPGLGQRSRKILQGNSSGILPGQYDIERGVHGGAAQIAVVALHGAGRPVPPKHAKEHGLQHVFGIRRIAGDPVRSAEDHAVMGFEQVFEFVRNLFIDNGFLFICELQRPPPGSSYLKTGDLPGYYNRSCTTWNCYASDTDLNTRFMAKKPPSSPVEKLPVPVELIERRIYMIRSQKVMLDMDLAALYDVRAFRLNEAVKRNQKRFPEDFMFQLTTEEWSSLTSQIAMSKPGRGGRRSAPYAFTEHGVAMLSSVLNSDRAVQMNILIIRAFVKLRDMLASHKDLAARMEKLEATQKQHTSVITVVVDEIKKLKAPLAAPSKPRIGFRTDD